MSSSVYTVDPWNLFAVALITVAGWAWIDHCQTRTSDFSRINYRWLPRMLAPRHAHEYASEGYNKINKKLGRPFRMTWWASENIFLPPEYLSDLKRASESSLSFLRNLSDAFSLGYSVGHLYDGPLMITIVRSKLNTQLPLITPILAEEADYAIDKEIGSSWTPRNAADVLTRIMHRMTSRILASPELCRDERYMSASISFMNSVTITGLLSIMFPLGPFRHLFVRILSLFHRRKLEAIIDIIEPVVRERLAAYSPDATTEPTHRDAIQWNIELAQGNPLELAPRRIALNTVQNLWAGSAGPAVTATQVIFQLLMMPAYFEPLVQEAHKAIEEHGWTDKALNQMHLLDSFIGEVNRMYPLGAVTAARTVMDEKFTFHDGLTLPKGSRIAFAIGAIQKDERFVENPETFNGYRFVAGAQAQEEGPESTADGAVNRAQSAATVTPTNLVFGYGKHACPGRFYAIRKIKIIFCKIAFRYDFKWTKVPKGRPQDFPVEGQFAPNQSQEISFRDRSEAAH